MGHPALWFRPVSSTWNSWRCSSRIQLAPSNSGLFPPACKKKTKKKPSALRSVANCVQSICPTSASQSEVSCRVNCCGNRISPSASRECLSVSAVCFFFFCRSQTYGELLPKKWDVSIMQNMNNVHSEPPNQILLPYHSSAYLSCQNCSHSNINTRKISCPQQQIEKKNKSVTLAGNELRKKSTFATSE